MSTPIALAVYFVCWWIVLFAVLPLRIGQQPSESERDPFADASGAPRAPHMGVKLLITTVVSAVIFAALYTILALQLVTLDTLLF